MKEKILGELGGRKARKKKVLAETLLEKSMRVH